MNGTHKSTRKATLLERTLAVFGSIMLVMSLFPTQAIAEARDELNAALAESTQEQVADEADKDAAPEAAADKDAAKDKDDAKPEQADVADQDAAKSEQSAAQDEKSTPDESQAQDQQAQEPASDVDAKDDEASKSDEQKPAEQEPSEQKPTAEHEETATEQKPAADDAEPAKPNDTAEPATESEPADDAADDDAADDADDEEPEDEEAPNTKTGYVYEDSQVRVKATIANADAVPDDAELRVTPVRAADYDIYISALNDTSANEAEYSADNTLLYDVKFVVDGQEIEPEEGAVKVSFEFKKSQLTKDIDAQKKGAVEVTHLPVANNGAVVVEPLNANVSLKNQTAEFTTPSFSVFGFSYTVDFTYDGYTYSIAGEDSIALSDLLTILKIDVDLADVADVAFTNTDLVAVEKDGDDYQLVSKKPFKSDEKLTITLTNGDKYVVDVTDATTSTNLKDYLTDASIKADIVDGKYVLKKGQKYQVKLSFAETEALHFPESGSMKYELPNGFDKSFPDNGQIAIVIKDTDGQTYTVNGNEYKIENGIITFTWNENDSNFSKLTESTNVSFNLEFWGKFDENAENIVFSDEITRTVEVIEPHNVTIQKNGEWDSANNCYKYTVTVHSEGTNTNVLVTDWLESDSLLVYQKDATYTRDKSEGAESVDPNNTGSGFTYTFPSMEDDETITITYTAKIDTSKIPDGGQVQDESLTKNSASVKSDEQSTEETATKNHQWTTYTSTNKKGELNEGSDEITWKITANSEKMVSIAKSTISDTIDKDSQGILEYSGTGPIIEVYANRQKEDGGIERYLVDTRKPTWSELGMTGIGDYDWQYTVPEDDGIYEYVITYTTTVDDSKLLVKTNVKNGVEGPSATSGSDTVTVGPGKPFSASKTHSNLSETGVTWTVSFVLPKGKTFDSVVLTDTYPSQQGGQYQDTLKEGTEIKVTGLKEGEHFVTSDDTSKAFTLIFYKNEGTDSPGLLTDDEEDRTITVTYESTFDPEWVTRGRVDTWMESHVNNASVTVNTTELKPSDQVTPINTSISKTGNKEPAGTTSDGLPYWRYEVKIGGITSDSVTIDDEFPTEYLEVYYPADGLTDANEVYGGTQYTLSTQYSYAAVDNTDTGATFTLTNLSKGTDSYEDYYRLTYYLKVKDDAALKGLQQFAATTDNTATLSNTATYNKKTSDEVDVTYTYTPLDKKLLNKDALNASNRTAHFSITWNPGGAQLNNGEDITLTDEFSTTLNVLYDTISFSNNSAVVTYNVSGHTATYVIKDKEPVTITYDAIVIGTGSLELKNTASALTYEDNVEVTKDFGSSGGGTGDVLAIKLLKHETGKMDRRIAGATFQLFNADDDTAVQHKSATGNVYITTGDDGTATLSGSLCDVDLYLKHKYYLKETVAPAGYELSTQKWYFTLTDQPNDVDTEKYIYPAGYTMRVTNNAKKTGIRLQKTFAGDLSANDLTDVQKKAIQFTVSKPDSDESDDVDDSFNEKYSYDQFTDGMYEISDLAVGVYTVTETVPTIEGYTLSTSYTIDGTEQTGNSGTIEITTDDVENSTKHIAQVVNTYNADTGALKLTKAVTVNGGSTTGTAADDTYYFTVTGPGSDGSVSKNVEITVTDGQVASAKVDGSSVDLTSDGFVVLADLAVGDYTITETTPTNGTAISEINGTETTSYSTTVTVVADDTTAAQASVTFTNNIDTGDLRITKQVRVNGRETTGELADGTYTFHVAGVAGSATSGYSEDISLTITNGSPANTVITGLVPGDYTVTETSGNNKSVTLDTEEKKVTVEAGKTSTAAPLVTITNNFETKTVTANKKWLDATGAELTSLPDDASVTFEVYQADADNKATGDALASVILNGTATETDDIPADGDTVSGYASGAWEATFKNLPKLDSDGAEINYIVKEASEFNNFINQNPDGVAAGETISNKEKPGSLKITKNVTVNGVSMTGNLADGTYKFTVKDSEGNDAKKADGSDVGTIEITIENGKSNTVEVTDLAAGKYTITEAATDNGTAVVGESSVEVTVAAGQTGDAVADGGIATFTNNIDTGDIKIEKKVTGTTDNTKEFNFEVTFTAPTGVTLATSYAAMKNGEAVDNVTVADNKVTGITLKADEYFEILGLPVGTKFTVAETGTLPQGYAQGEHTNYQNIAVTKNPEQTATMKNIYSATDATETLEAQKTLNGEKPADKQFEFSATADADNPTSGLDGRDFIASATNDANGKVSFGKLKFTGEGTWMYTVKEISTDGEGITTDKSEYVVTYVVKDGGAGELNVTRTIVQTVDKDGKAISADDQAAQEGITLAFANTYSAEGTANIEIEKKIVNGTWPVDEDGKAKVATFKLVPESADAPKPDNDTVSIDSAQNVSFGDMDLSVDQAGITYKYTITETSDWNVEGAKYKWEKSADVKVELTVKHDGKGNLTADVTYDTTSNGAITNTYTPDQPSFEKKIKDTNDSTGDTSNWQDSADYDIGDMVPYKLTATLATDVTSYHKYHITFKDQMERSLTFASVGNIKSVRVIGADENPVDAETYTVEKTRIDDQNFTVKLTWEGEGTDGLISNTNLNGATVEVEFEAELNSGAELGEKGNVNAAQLLYSHKPEDFDDTDDNQDSTDWDYVIAFTYKVDIKKVNADNEALEGAKFTLYKKYATAPEGVKLDAEGYGKVHEAASPANGQFSFTGLDDGTYKLVETEAPKGYKAIDPITFVVKADHDETIGDALTAKWPDTTGEDPKTTRDANKLNILTGISSPVNSDKSTGALSLGNAKKVEFTDKVNVITDDTLDTPDFEKKIKDTNDSSGETSDWQDSADYDIGDDVPYRLTAKLPSDIESYKNYHLTFTDKMEPGLTFNNDITVKVDGKTVSAGNYNLAPDSDNHGFVLTLRWGDEPGDDQKAVAASTTGYASKDVEVLFTAKLTGEDVNIGEQGNVNGAKLSYSNNPAVEDGSEEGEKPWDYVIAFTYKVDVNKTDDAGQSLNGAGFTLYKKFASAPKGVTPYDSDEYEGYYQIGTEQKQTSGNEFSWKGLDDGDYLLVETTVPTGYVAAEPVAFTVAATHGDTWTYSENWQGAPATDATGRAAILTELTTGDKATGAISLGESHYNATTKANTVQNTKLGGLKITKKVTVNGQPTTTTAADGEYTFTITKKDDEEQTHAVVIKITNGGVDSYTLDGKAGTELDDDGYVTVPNLEAGTYIVSETSGESGVYLMGDNDREMVVENGSDKTIPTETFTNNKPGKPDFEKKIKDTNDSTGETSGWQDSADYDLNDDVPYKLTATLPNDASSYKYYHITFTDQMENMLTLNQGSFVVKVNGETLGEEKYNLEPNNHDFALTLRWGKSDESVVAESTEGLDNAVVTVEFTAKLDGEDADVNYGSLGNVNGAKLTYSNNPTCTGEGDTDNDTTEDTPWDYVIAFTYKVDINKVNKDEEPLEGAKFKLEKKLADGTTKPVVIDEETSTGTTFSFKGLDDGDYILTETKAPAGYRPIDPIEFTVTANHKDNDAWTNHEGKEPNYDNGPAGRDEILESLSGEVKDGVIDLTPLEEEDEDILKGLTGDVENKELDKPDFEKKIADINDSTGTEHGDWQDSADYDIGDDVPYKLTAKLPEDVTSYKNYHITFTDEMEESLTFNEVTEVKVFNGETEIATYSAEDAAELIDSSSSHAFALSMSWSGEEVDGKVQRIANKKLNNATVEVYFTAKLQDDTSAGDEGKVKLGNEGNVNGAKLTYSTNPNYAGEGEEGGSDDEDDKEEDTTEDTDWDYVIAFTYKVDINKVDDQGNAVKGAKFTLVKVNAEDEETVVGTYTASMNDEGTTFSFEGLDDGTYVLKETAPKNYKAIDPITFTVTADHSSAEGENEWDVSSKGDGPTFTLDGRYDILDSITTDDDLKGNTETGTINLGLFKDEDENFDDTNYVVNQRVGNLTITKNIGGVSKEDLTDDVLNKEFSIIVINDDDKLLRADGGEPITISESDSMDEKNAFLDNLPKLDSKFDAAVMKVSANEPLELEGLPVGFYRVFEVRTDSTANINGYFFAGVTGETPDGTEVTIGETTTVALRNSYTEQDLGSLKLTKTIDSGSQKFLDEMKNVLWFELVKKNDDGTETHVEVPDADGNDTNPMSLATMIDTSSSRTTDGSTVTWWTVENLVPGEYSVREYRLDEAGKTDDIINIIKDDEGNYTEALDVTVVASQESAAMSELALTNIYAEVVAHFTPAVTKALDDTSDPNYEGTDTFTFTLEKAELTGVERPMHEKDPGDEPFFVGTGGQSTVEARVGDTASFGQINFSETGTYYYVITEATTDAAGITSSEPVYVRVDVTADGVVFYAYNTDPEALKALDPAQTDDETGLPAGFMEFDQVADPYAPITIENHYAAGSLTVTKAFSGLGIEDLTDEQKAAITFTVENTDTGTALALSLAEFDDVDGVPTWTLEHLVPGNYKVTETGYDLDGYDADVTYSVDEDGEVEVVADNTAEVKVTNTYSPNRPGSEGASAQLKVKKVVKATSGTYDGDEKFSFTLTAAEAYDLAGNAVEVPMPNKVTASAAADKTAVFGKITYTEPGYYIYKINEVEPEDKTAGMSYDTADRYALVSVDENYNASVLYGTDPDADGESSLTITNTYTPTTDETSAQIKVKKVVSGSKYTGSEKFTFTLAADNDAAKTKLPKVRTVSIKAGETGVFGKITYTKEGWYSYTVTESVPEKKTAGMTYNTHSYHVSVWVTKGTNGKLSADVYHMSNIGEVENAKPADKPLTITNYYSTSTSKKPTPKTGDPTLVLEVQALALTGALGIAAGVLRRRKRH